jgi:hypothetical protein
MYPKTSHIKYEWLWFHSICKRTAMTFEKYDRAVLIIVGAHDQHKPWAFIGGVIRYASKIWIRLNLSCYANVIGEYLVYQAHWKRFAAKALSDKSRVSPKNILPFNIHRTYRCQRRVATCGGKSNDHKSVSYSIETFTFRTFKMEKDDGTFIEVRIPPFNLECKSDPMDTKTIV